MAFGSRGGRLLILNSRSEAPGSYQNVTDL
jgi:hypothetical protein